VFEGVRTGGLARAAAAKFAGSWFACLLVMARGNIFAAFGADHLLRATVCGTVGAVFTVALLAQMDRSLNSVSRQATLSAVVTLIGDVFAHPSHFGPQWAEPVVTAAVSAGIAVAACTSGSGCAPPKIEFCRREHKCRTPAADPCVARGPWRGVNSQQSRRRSTPASTSHDD